MSTRSAGRRAAARRKEDLSSLCSFTFTDSRQCRTPRREGHPHLCAFHARKEAQALAGDKTGRDIAYHLPGGYFSDYDLRSALGRLSATRRRPNLTAIQAGSGGRHSPKLAQIKLSISTFRMNTCKSVSKQSTLTPLRIIIYAKPGGTVYNPSNFLTEMSTATAPKILP